MSPYLTLSKASQDFIDKKNLSGDSETLVAESALLKAQCHALKAESSFFVPAHGSSMRAWIAAKSEEMVAKLAGFMEEFDAEVANPKEREEVKKVLRRDLEKSWEENMEAVKLRDEAAQYKARSG